MKLPKPFYERRGVTIYHGDCREILPKMSKPDLIVTDPPYGIGLDYGEGFDDSPDSYWKWFLPVAEMLKSTSPLIMFHRQDAIRYLTGWTHVCVWNKPMAFGYAIKGWLAHWEPIFVYGAQPQTVYGNSKPAKFDVFTFCTERNDTGHPCPKPFKLMRAVVETFPGNIVCDPFMGSGTTLSAARACGRRAIGIELNGEYCEMAARVLDGGKLALKKSLSPLFKLSD
jgi:site-specific DNA-methyltransferase (adenine-specific)